MSRPSPVEKNAAGVPVFTVNGVIASIRSCCSLSNSSVGSTTLDPPQLPSSRPLRCQNASRSGIDLVELGRADELLQHRDVRVVRRIKGEALREVAKQAGICTLRMLDPRCVRFERDVAVKSLHRRKQLQGLPGPAAGFGRTRCSAFIPTSRPPAKAKGKTRQTHAHVRSVGLLSRWDLGLLN
jgi:hypothetical protein